MQLDNWSCNLCGCKDRLLHVHHLRYLNKEVYDYSDAELITLCEDCHNKESNKDALLSDFKDKLKVICEERCITMTETLSYLLYIADNIVNTRTRNVVPPEWVDNLKREVVPTDSQNPIELIRPF